MPRVRVQFAKQEYFPGDAVEGEVIIQTSSNIECNRVVLKLKGKEYTEMSSGDTKIKDSFFHLKDIKLLHRGGIISEGTTRLPFSFSLPNGIPPTFQGYYGRVDYSAEAVIEQNWRLDPKQKTHFLVSPQPTRFIRPPEQMESRIRKKGSLSVDMPTSIIRPEGLPFSLRVDPRSRVDEVRVHLIRRQRYKCQGREKDEDKVVLGIATPIRESDFERWKEYRLPKHIRPMMVFRGHLIQIGYILKFTLGVNLGFDDVIIIPVQFSAPERTDVEIEEKEMGDLLDDIAMDLDQE